MDFKHQLIIYPEIRSSGPHKVCERGFRLEATCTAVYERKAFLVKNTVKWIGLRPWARASLYKTLLPPFLLSMDIVIQKKTHKL